MFVLLKAYLMLLVYYKEAAEHRHRFNRSFRTLSL